MLWFSRELHRPDLAKKELADVKSLHSTMNTGNSPVNASRHIPLELLWWKPIPLAMAATSLPLHWTSQGGFPSRSFARPGTTNQVAKVQRTVKLNADRSVLLEDQWTTANHPVAASWQWLTQAKVSRPYGKRAFATSGGQNTGVTSEGFWRLVY